MCRITHYTTHPFLLKQILKKLQRKKQKLKKGSGDHSYNKNHFAFYVLFIPECIPNEKSPGIYYTIKYKKTSTKKHLDTFHY
jgi:hypothetical protein